MLANTRRSLVVLAILAVASPLQAQFNPFNPYGTPVNQAQFAYGMQANPAAAAYSYGAYSNPAISGSVMPVNPYASTIGSPGYGGYGYGGYNPYLPYGYGGYGIGAELYGTAEVLKAYGQLSNQFEQSRIMREQAMQAKIKTAKDRFDFQLYVKANTPTFTQEQAKIASQRLKRIQSNSSPAEISSGTALNVLLDDLRRHPNKRVTGIEPIILGEDVLKHVNVVKNAGNLGILRDDGKFTWPVAFADDNVLSADERKKIELTAQTAVQKAFKDQLDVNLVKELGNLVRSSREKLAARVNDIPTGEYLDAKRFLNDFDDARQALEKNEAKTLQEYRKFIAGGTTIDKMVEYLASNGLKIAPATARDEAAYRAVYSAMAALDVAINAGAVVAEAAKE